MGVNVRIFVSSLIGGFEVERAAAKGAIGTLRHEPVMAENFGAQPNSPQVACLQGLREADLVVLILGERYGQPQASGISATHEEYREAKVSKPILAFVQEGISPELEQQAFIQEVQEWEGGVFRQGFADADDLRTAVTRALHDYDLTAAHAPVDSEELKRIAEGLLPDVSRSQFVGSGATLSIAIAGGPPQQLIRAAMIEDGSFADSLQQAAQFGPTRIFGPSDSTDRRVENDALVLRQESGASLTVDEGANLLIQAPLDRQDRNSRFGLEGSVIIEESVVSAMRNCLEFGSQFLDEVDRTQRLTHLAIAVSISNADYRGWRTQAEQNASPNSVEIGMSGARDRRPVAVDVQRPAIRLNRNGIVEDITVRLRRQWRSRS